MSKNLTDMSHEELLIFAREMQSTIAILEKTNDNYAA